MAGTTRTEVERLLTEAAPHLDGCDIQAVRRPESDADWVPVQALARAAHDITCTLLAAWDLAELAETGRERLAQERDEAFACLVAIGVALDAGRVDVPAVVQSYANCVRELVRERDEARRLLEEAWPRE